MALYHTHRPQSFKSLVGQEHIVKTIQNQVAHELIAHAYIFFGPRGIGKTSTARILARAANCSKRKKGQSEPCNTCEQCTAVMAGASLDVIEIDAASHTGVDHVREQIIENARFHPSVGLYKVFIIDEVHMLSTSAFNALLKILEEPPAYVIFVLATTNLQKLPQTVVSRCQTFTFSRAPYDLLATHIASIAKKEKQKIDPDVLQSIAHAAEGCIRDAVTLFEQIMAAGYDHITMKEAAPHLRSASAYDVAPLLELISQKSRQQSLSALHTLHDTGSPAISITDALLSLLRDVLVSQASGNDGHTDFSDAIALMNLQDVQRMTDMLLHRRGQIAGSPIDILPLELFVIEWCEENMPNPPSQKKDKEVEVPAVARTHVKRKVEKISAKKANSPMTLEQVTKHWQSFLPEFEKHSPSLKYVLGCASVSRIDGSVVVLTVESVFHKTTLEADTQRRGIEKALSAHCGHTIRIQPEVKEQPSSDIPSAPVHTLAAAFGGEVVS
jgi:DNA polymerase III subunit gamma/tau